MEPAKRFTRLTIGGTLALSGIIAAVMWHWDAAAARGFMAGGAAGAGGFWFMANRAARLATIPQDRLPYHIYRWTFLRIGVYGIALGWAYTVDRQEHHALIAAVFGLLLVRVVMVTVGLTVSRVRAEKETKEPYD